MRKVLFLSIFLSISSFGAGNGTGLLLKTDGEDIDIKSTIGTQKQLQLDDSFLVHLFGSWKASGALMPKVNDWVMKVLNKKFKEALVEIPAIEKDISSRFQNTFAATKAYLLYRNDLGHSFIDLWLELAANKNLLGTEIGLALDFVVGEKMGLWVVKNGFQFTQKQSNLLSQVEKLESRINYNLQSWKALRSGKNALNWVRKISEKNPIKIKLVNTILLAFARDGKLKASAKLIKEVFEPIVEKSDNTDEVAFYYLTLARLLYQARAFEASKQYYYAIPKSSKYFLDARTEVVWNLIQLNDLGAVKGELASLTMDLFENRFAPEVYLVSAIANIKTCQFENVKKNFDFFLSRNRVWAKKIGENLNAKKAKEITNDFYLESTKKSLVQIQKEQGFFGTLKKAYWAKETRSLAEMKVQTEKNQALELKRRWKNREIILDQAIYKMRFVKIEFISRMRELALNLAQADKDSVSLYQAAPKHSNQIEFPYDGMVWGDEVFSFTSDVKNLCLKGLKK